MTETQSNEDTPTNGVQSYNQDKAAEILKQVEYYFGDINLPRDKFLLNEMKAENGWVPLATMLKFNRLAKISEDINELADALKASDLIEVNEDNDSIRRSIMHPLPDNTLEYWLEVKRRTVCVKGFPQDSTIDELLSYMHQHGDVVNVLMRKTKSEPRVFKGSIFATFAKSEEAEKFANSEETISYKDQPLTKCMQEAYWANKAKEIKEKKQEMKFLKQGKNNKVSQEQKEGINAAHFVKGIVLKVQGLPQNCTINKLKEYFGQFGDVAYVKLAKENSDETFVRFKSNEENAAQTSWNKAVGEDGKATFEHNDTKYELTGKLLEGEEESAYWVEFNNFKLRANLPTLHYKNKRGSKRHVGPENDVAEKKPKRIVFDNNGEDLPFSKHLIDRVCAFT